jgi:hypothetical protein
MSHANRKSPTAHKKTKEWAGNKGYQAMSLRHGAAILLTAWWLMVPDLVWTDYKPGYVVKSST